MIWLICGIGGLTALSLFFICRIWSKWTKEAVDAGAYCTQMPEEDYSHLWEVRTCESCRKQCEVYIPERECQACLVANFFHPEQDEEEGNCELKRLRLRCFELETQVLLLEARVKWLGSNPFGD